VADLKFIEATSQAFRIFPEGAEDGTGDLILPFHLLDHELRVGDDTELAGGVLPRPGEDGEKAFVFGVVIGLNAEELTEASDDAAMRIFDDGSEAGGAGVSARSAVAVGGEPGGGGGGGVGKKGGRHDEVSVTTRGDRRQGSADRVRGRGTDLSDGYGGGWGASGAHKRGCGASTWMRVRLSTGE